MPPDCRELLAVVARPAAVDPPNRERLDAGSPGDCDPEACRAAGSSTASKSFEAGSGTGERMKALAAKSATVLDALLSTVREALERLASADSGSIQDDPRIVAASALCAVSRADRLSARLRACGGRQALCAAEVEPFALLHSLADTLGQTLDRRMAVTVDVERACPTCHADPRALEDALVELVVNARDAMAGGGSLVLSARECVASDGGRSVEVAVADSGAGMSRDVLRRALQPFFTTKPNDPSAGLGLPAVAGFAMQSGGRIALSSSPGRGSTAVLRLPCGPRAP